MMFLSVVTFHNRKAYISTKDAGHSFYFSLCVSIVEYVECKRVTSMFSLFLIPVFFLSAKRFCFSSSSSRVIVQNNV